MVGTTLFQDMVLLSSFYDINDSKRELILLDTVSAVSLMQLLNKINQELTEQKDVDKFLSKLIALTKPSFSPLDLYEGGTAQRCYQLT